MKTTIHYIGIYHNDEERWAESTKYVIEQKAKILCLESSKALTPYFKEILKTGEKRKTFPLRNNCINIIDSELIPSILKINNELSNLELYLIDNHELKSGKERDQYMAQELSRLLMENYEETNIYVILHENHFKVSKILTEQEFFKNYYTESTIKKTKKNKLKILKQLLNKKRV